MSASFAPALFGLGLTPFFAFLAAVGVIVALALLAGKYLKAQA